MCIYYMNPGGKSLERQRELPGVVRKERGEHAERCSTYNRHLYKNILCNIVHMNEYTQQQIKNTKNVLKCAAIRQPKI